MQFAAVLLDIKAGAKVPDALPLYIVVQAMTSLLYSGSGYRALSHPLPRRAGVAKEKMPPLSIRLSEAYITVLHKNQRLLKHNGQGHTYEQKGTDRPHLRNKQNR